MQFFAHFFRICAVKGEKMKKNIAILASGNGTNAERIARYFERSDTVCVRLVLTNRNTAFALQRAEALGIENHCFSKEQWVDGSEVLALLQRCRIDFVVLAGFLARVPNNILAAFPGRMVNIHPSLLPKFGGKGMYGDRVHQAVIEAGERESGITIHYTSEIYDEGAVVFQAACPVLPDDTPETLAARVHALEYEHYPQVIERLLKEI